MRPQKVENTEMLAGLMAVLRSKGYDGASLNDLAEATGLKKASLYHRFSGGKKEMAEAVLRLTQMWIDANIYQVLGQQELSLEKRLRKVLKTIAEFYDDGAEICILRAMSMDTGLRLFGEQIKISMNLWIDAFTQIGVEKGWSEEVARAQAIQGLVNIQGSLIVAKGLEDLGVFTKAIKALERSYLV